MLPVLLHWWGAVCREGTYHCLGVVCGERELVNDPGVCEARLLPPNHLAKRHKERDGESLCTHP